MRAALLLLLLWLLLPTPAHAEVTVRPGLAAGGGEIGDRGLSWLGLHFGVERRIGDITLAVEGGYVGMTDDDRYDPWKGRMFRAAVIVRTLLAETRQASPLTMDAWFDLGLGAEAIEWDEGGVLYRPELLVGMSGLMGARIGSNSRYGDFLSVHLLISHGPACLGPCADEVQLGIQVSTGMFLTD